MTDEYRDLPEEALRELAQMAESDGDDEGAMMFLTLAAEKGDPLSQTRLGLIYSNDESLLDLGKAESLFRAAAESGYARAMFELGDFMYTQDKVEEAYDWYRKGALRGDSDCKLRMKHFGIE